MPAKKGAPNILSRTAGPGNGPMPFQFTGRKLVTVPSQNAQVYDSGVDLAFATPQGGRLAKRMPNSKLHADSYLLVVLLILTSA